MKNLTNLLKKVAITFLLTAALIGNTRAYLLPDYDYTVSTLGEEDYSYIDGFFNK